MSFKSINGVIDRNTTDGWSGYPNEFLEFLYSRVVEKNPSTVLEFGTGWGYTTIALAQGIKDSENVNGMVYTYDHFVDDYDGTWTNNQTAVNNNLTHFGVQDYVKTHSMDIFKWFDNPFKFDLAFVDLHNRGEILNKLFNNEFIKKSVENGSEILFCGGSEIRDEINVIRNEQPISSIDCKIECVFGGPSEENPKGMKSCIAKIVGY